MARRKQLPVSILGPKGYRDTTHDEAVHNIAQEQYERMNYNRYGNYCFEPFRKEVWLYFDEKDQMFVVAFVKVYATREVVWERHSFVEYSKALLFFDAYSGILF